MARNLISRLKTIRHWRKFGTTKKTISSIPCDRGDVVLVPFKFADSNRIKRRPAVVLTVSSYHNTRTDMVLVGLTSRRVEQHFFGDARIMDWRAAGLPSPSKAKAVIQTVDRSLIVSRLGCLSPDDMTRVHDSVREILGL